MPTLADLRDDFHEALRQDLLGVRQTNGQPRTVPIQGHNFPVFSNADGHNVVSVVLCAGVAQRLQVAATPRTGGGSTSGNAFERCTRDFVTDTLDLFAHLHRRQLVTLPGRSIGHYAQFEHLGAIQALVQNSPQLQAALGGDYLVKPDILVMFEPFSDADLNAGGAGITPQDETRSPVRAALHTTPILHASISCKWTMRRDRAQNTRLEALNLVRNRKGRLPHVAAVTMECDPEIVASLCLGTGDIDCVYHGALPELLDAADVAAQTFTGRAWGRTRDSFARMVDGSRLRDIADLPLDLLV